MIYHGIWYMIHHGIWYMINHGTWYMIHHATHTLNLKFDAMMAGMHSQTF